VSHPIENTRPESAPHDLFIGDRGDKKDVQSFLKDFFNGLSAEDKKIYGDTFKEFSQHFKALDRGTWFRRSAAEDMAPQLHSVLEALGENPNLFKGSIPRGATAEQALNYIREHLTPQNRGLESTLKDLVSDLKQYSIAGSQFDSELASVLSLLGNEGKTGHSGHTNNCDMSQINSDMLENTRKAGKPRRPGEQDGEDGGGGESGGGGGRGVGRGGSIFERLALAMGEAMDKKLQEMLDAAESANNLATAKGDPGAQDQNVIQQNQAKLMTANAQVTARGQELTMMSQSYNSAINALGSAAATAARKA